MTTATESASKDVPREPRVSREQGMQRMVAATIDLLAERRPEQITVRDIAGEAGHHHRFVQAWFGGKVELFRVVFDELADRVASQVRPGREPGDAFGPDIFTLTSLMNWLVATDPRALSGPRPTPILDRIVETYQAEYGLEADVARLMALRVVGGSIAIMLFDGPLGLQPDDLGRLVELEQELATLLAASRASR